MLLRGFCMGTGAIALQQSGRTKTQNDFQKCPWTKKQWHQLNRMNLTHLEYLRLENRRVAFNFLVKTQKNPQYLVPLCELNRQGQRGSHKTLEKTLLSELYKAVFKIRKTYIGKSRGIQLGLLIENLIYLMERAEHYTPSEEMVIEVLRLIPPDVRLEARLKA